MSHFSKVEYSIRIRNRILMGKCMTGLWVISDRSFHGLKVCNGCATGAASGGA